MKKLFLTGIATLAAASMCFTACSAMDGNGWKDEGSAMMPMAPDIAGSDYDEAGGAGDNYVYENIREQGFSSVSENASSYFSLDRNTATYSLVRSQIEYGGKVSAGSVRIEELINYFDYDFTAPEEKAVSVSGYLADCPWNENNKLMLAGVKTTQYDLSDKNGNYVFLIDVSGSMSGDKRLGLAKKGFNMLLEQLGENDVVSLVTYASGVNTVLDGVECTQSGKTKIQNSISKLTAGGATSGGDGLDRAYRLAQEHFITGGNNRIIIISDGDFNVGISDTMPLKEFIQEKAKSGIYLSAIGVGMGNMRDDMMETLATNGNGNYAYLDNETEAEKVFVKDLNGTMVTVAKDAKAGVTFTDQVEKYRLIGYDTKIISEDDFNNEQADTGEIGSNLCVAALYEITLKAGAEGDIAEIEVRYKDVTGEEEISESCKFGVNVDTPSSEDLSFITCVAEFGLVLRNSQYKGTADLKKVLTRLEDLHEYTAKDKYKTQFGELVKKADQSGFYK